LFHLATCLVNYSGHRVICQSIIPGILNNSDLSSLAEYGTVDEKKNIVATEAFHALMVKVADALNIKVNKVVDPSDGKVVEIAGSIEVKGIRGADKRAYIVDLQGLTPRDANYIGDEFHTCLLRPELLALYQRAKSRDYATGKMKEFVKELESKREPEPKAKEGEELTEEQKAQITKAR
jgi:protein TIF31